MKILPILILLLALIVISQARRHKEHNGEKSGHGRLHGLHRHRGSLTHYRRLRSHGPYNQYINHYDRHHLRRAHHRGLHKSVVDQPQTLVKPEIALENTNKEKESEEVANVVVGDNKEGQNQMPHHGFWGRFKHYRHSMQSSEENHDENVLNGAEENQQSHHHCHHGGRHHRYRHHGESTDEKNIEEPDNKDEKQNDKTSEEYQGAEYKQESHHHCRHHHHSRHDGHHRHHHRHHYEAKDETNIDEAKNESESKENGGDRHHNGHRHHHENNKEKKDEEANPMEEKNVNPNADSDEEYFGKHRKHRHGHHGRHGHHPRHRCSHKNFKPNTLSADEKDVVDVSASNENNGTTEQVLLDEKSNVTEGMTASFDVRLGPME
ncbi:uncharacterized protein [Musca autumnalis]|uniref:uncharacterized protein n=1 Tax=Musca autumnalis TaxID=221902 RepID=UPI003CE8ADFA